MKNNIQSQLEIVFCPENLQVRHALWIRGNTSDEEACRETDPFVGKEWPEIGVDIWREHRNALTFMEPAAACYYLPSLILATLAEIEKTAHVVEDFAATFSIRGLPEWRAMRDYAWMQFNSVQLMTVLGWMEYVRRSDVISEDEIEAAMEKLCMFIAEKIEGARN